MAIAVPSKEGSEQAPDARFEALVLDLLAHLEFERGLARNTLDAYRTDLEVMYGCGLRASEATGLDVGDVDTERGFVRPHGKGNKERVVPLGREAAKAVQRYLSSGRPELVGVRPEPRLFVNFRGGAL